MISFTSVSQLARFDHAQDGGCELRWYKKTIQKIKEPERAATNEGSKVHSQLEHYLGNNQDVLGKIALQGKHLLPPPGPHESLFLEWGLNDKPRPPPKDGKQVNWFPPEESLVKLAGLPLVGFEDVIDARQSYVQEDGTTLVEPGVVEVLDHKTASDKKWTKEASDFIKSPQMLGYGKFVTQKFPWVQKIRLSQIYYLTKPPPPGEKTAWKKSALFDLAIIASAWYSLENIGERMKSAAGQRSEREVEGNLRACNSFGGCPHKPTCHVYQAQTITEKLQSQFGTNQTKESKKMSAANALLARVKGLNPATPTNGAVFAPPPAVPVVQAPAAPAPAAPAAGLVASQAIQGAQYAFANGLVGQFLAAFDAGGGVLKYSFLPFTNGAPSGAPFHANATDAIYALPAAPAPAPVVAAAPPPPTFPTGQTPWAAAPAPVAPPPPAAAPRKLFVPPEVTTAPAPVVAAPPPPAFAPPPQPAAPPIPATAAAEGRTGPKLAKAPKAAKSASAGVDAQDLVEAIAASKAIYGLCWPNQAPTAADLAPIWQALLGI